MTPESAKSDRKPLPRYAMPDGSEPEYGAILEQIQNYRKSMIGSSFFYIQARPGRALPVQDHSLWRKDFFHEIVDHQEVRNIGRGHGG